MGIRSRESAKSLFGAFAGVPTCSRIFVWSGVQRDEKALTIIIFAKTRQLSEERKQNKWAADWGINFARGQACR